jgi:hypothetical protein
MVGGLFLVAGITVAQDTTGTKAAKAISYKKEVEPILLKYCATCHNADDEHPSELYMDTYETLMKGGKHGKAVLPGNAKESLIIMKTDTIPPFGKMMPPPNKKVRPTAQQLETIRLWIEQGAKNN